MEPEQQADENLPMLDDIFTKRIPTSGGGHIDATHRKQQPAAPTAQASQQEQKPNVPPQ